MLRVEINQIISGLVEKHQVHRVVSQKMRPLMQDRVWTVGDSDPEDAEHEINLSRMSRASQVRA